MQIFDKMYKKVLLLYYNIILVNTVKKYVYTAKIGEYYFRVFG